MKYTVDTNAQTIKIIGSFKYEDYIEVFKKYSDFTFSMENPSYTVTLTSSYSLN
jgi:hypothetical protein